jgi:hypothetical protein
LHPEGSLFHGGSHLRYPRHGGGGPGLEDGISRWEGGIFFLYYGVYLTLLLVDAAGHDARDLLLNAVLVFVLPLTAVTALLGWWRAKVV